MVDTLKDIGPGTIVIAGEVQVKVYKIDSKPAERTYRKISHPHGAPFFSESDYYNRDEQVVTSFVASTMIVKAVPATWTGHAKSSDCSYHTLSLFASGDQEAYWEWCKKDKNGYRDALDVSHAMVAVSEDAPKPIGDLKGFAKMDLICAVIMVHGPSTRDDVLRRVAAMEGKPWVISSNHEYFAGNRQGAIEDHSRGPRGRKLYKCTVEGLRRGAQVVDRFGMEAIQKLA